VRSCSFLHPAAVGLPCVAVAVASFVPPPLCGQVPLPDTSSAFRVLVPETATLEKVAGPFRFTEGPAWDALAGCLVFSDIPASRLYRYEPASGAAPAVFREPTAQANGNFYADGALYTCEHEGRRVAVQRAGGPVETLVDRFEGKRFSSPNDVVVKSDGTVWFTDPTYGLGDRPKEQAANRVYCFDPRSRSVHAVVDDFDQPNGLCFSPDEHLLYIADSGRPRHVRVFDVSRENQLSAGRVFCAIDHGVPDGMRCDRFGNLFSTSANSVQVFSPAGERLGVIPVPETPANLCFGGADGHDLYITARTSLYRIRLTTSGAGFSAR
jgi:gluconolactonase